MNIFQSCLMVFFRSCFYIQLSNFLNVICRKMATFICEIQVFVGDKVHSKSMTVSCIEASTATKAMFS
jgi:hypothetical protein